MALITLTGQADTYPGGTFPTAAAGDTLLGLDGNDTIRGTTGGIIIAGNQGEDQLFAAGPNTTLLGGKNNDTLVSVSQSKLYGDEGNDSLVAVFSDTLYGGGLVSTDSLGNDTLIGAPQAVLFGNAGKDSLVGATQASLYGGKDNDTLVGKGGGSLHGDFGNDFLVGIALDTLYGASSTGEDSIGSDTLAAQGSALLFGGIGTDTLYSATGATLFGGKDNDLLTPNTLAAGALGGPAAGQPAIVVGGAVLYGDKGDDTLYATFNATTNKADTLYGGADNDFLSPLKDNTGNYIGFGGTVTLVAYGGEGSDQVIGSNQGDSLFGGDQTVTLDGADTIMGRQGTDFISGGGGADSLNGADEKDTINGGDGNDSITGGAGSDSLTGGAGADQFFFVKSTNDVNNLLSNIQDIGALGADTITDFTPGEDKIVLSRALFSQLPDPAVQPVAPVSVSIETLAGSKGDASNALIVYNSADNTLFFNPSTGNDAVQIAVLTGVTSVSSIDFFVIA